MVFTTLKQAKAKLNHLVELAIQGEDVVLMRGSKHVAVIVPISENDLNLTVPLTDASAAKLWEAIESEQKSGKLRRFSSPGSAVKAMLK